MTLGALWILYFVSTVGGYLAMKYSGNLFPQAWIDVLLNVWGLMAMLLWGLSGLAFSWILARQSLHVANAVSSVRIVLISFAAVLCFAEPVTARQFAGLVLVVGGVILAC